MSALVASLLAVGSAPAGAAEIKTGDANTTEQNVKPKYSACVGEALDDHGFTDLGTLEGQVSNINCLAYYGISAGKPDGTFDPNSNVTRSQMALFLYAAADRAGVDMMGGDMMVDYGDISELGENRQNAINALARNGIMSGRGGMAFEPHADITRAEMAVALVSLVRHASPSLFDSNGALNIDSDELDHFADARATVPVAVDTAISYVYELNITSGYPDATFRPNDGVPRRNMATFIMNALAHTNLRPAGVSMQTPSAGEWRVSVRTADFKPVPEAAIDLFTVDTARIADALNDDGSCTRLPVTANDSTKCKIDLGDDITDTGGNLLASAAVAGGKTLIAWTGNDGDTFDADANQFRHDVAEGSAIKPATAVEVTTNLPKNAASSVTCSADGTNGCTQARYGTVTYTIQLKDADGNNAGPPEGGAKYRVKVTYPSTVVTLVEHSVDANGTATFDVTVPDSDKTALDTSPVAANSTLVEITQLTGTGITGGVDSTNNNALTVPQVIFTDTASALNTVTAETSALYRMAPGASVRNFVTVSVLDQYGQPMRNVPVTVVAAEGSGASVTAPADGSTPTVVRDTASNGKIRVFYTITAAVMTGGTETIQAFADADATTAGFQITTASTSSTVDFHWVREPVLTGNSPDDLTDSGNNTQDVLAGDPSKGTLILAVGSGNTPVLVVFDSNDQFTVTDADPNTTGDQTVFGMAAFVKAVSADANIAGTGTVAASVTVTNYNPNDSAAVASWVVS